MNPINLVKERIDKGNFKNIIDFVSRFETDVINKRQLENRPYQPKTALISFSG